LVKYIDCITPLFSSQRQVDDIYFDFSSAFDLLSYTLLSGKLGSFGLTSAYVSWFRNYQTDIFLCVKISGILSAPFRILDGSVLGPLLFNLSIDDICNVITHSKFLLFADDTKTFRAIKSFDDSTQLKLDTDSIHGWCTANYKNLNISKTRNITYSRKTNALLLKYKLGDSYITRNLRACATDRAS
jgi:hypothetical protein